MLFTRSFLGVVLAVGAGCDVQGTSSIVREADVSFRLSAPLSSCSDADVQRAIDEAADGDVVQLPAQSSCTWSERVTIPASKGITLDGAGSTVDGTIRLEQNTTTSSRITGFSFVRANAIETFGSPARAPYRIDHNTFTSTVSGQTLLDVGHGNGPGLVDHNTLRCPGNCEMVHNWGMGATDDSGWRDDVVPGSYGAVYLEDNSFINSHPGFGTDDPAYFWGSSAIQSYYGARTVFRYNQLLMSQVDQHGTAGNIGARWWEIYENTFSTDVPHANQCCFVTLRAGSGVVFGNHHVGQNFGSSIDLYEEDIGYPALYQIGRGKDQVHDPAYLWSNDSFFTIGSQTPGMVQLDRDYILAQKPAYTPFPYPYPLTPGGLPDPMGLSKDSDHDDPADRGSDADQADDELDTGGCQSSTGPTLTVTFVLSLLALMPRSRRRQRVSRSRAPR